MALAAVLTFTGCSDPASPDDPGPAPLTSRDAAAEARERLAQRVALALADDKFRTSVKQELDRSPFREHKVHFQRFLSAGQARATSEIAAITGEASAVVGADARHAPALELYLPVPAHRETWTGDDRVLVATAGNEREAPVAFSTKGKRVLLSPTTPPDIPVLALVPVETDFDRRPDRALQGDNSGGGHTPPAGLYMTNSHLVETFESWVKGAPEIEVHLLGQAGKTDSLTTYSCAAEPSPGYYRFDQNSLDWSGSVLLMSDIQLSSYKSAHPDQNLRVFVVEDDDTSCRIKTDPNRFATLVKAVEAAYPLLTGGRDSTSGAIQKLWKRANAIQKILKALASLIKTNDELIGNAVESGVVGESYPNANWVIKGENNRTNGWIKLVMK
jgi:hypothetical protein